MISKNRFRPSPGLRLGAFSGLLLGSGSAAASGDPEPSAVWLWLAGLPNWLLIALVAILLMGLAGLGLRLYRRLRQRAPASRATALTLIGSGLAGVLLALVVADDWQAFVLDQITSLPPTAIGPPIAIGPWTAIGPRTASLPPIATLLAEPAAELAMKLPRMPASALAARAGRGRHANVDFNALGATELRLNLFDDVELIAVRDRTVESRGARVWVGYIPGADHSEVFLTAKGGVMTGTISYEGRLFEILSANGATHAVREIDTKQIPEDIVLEAGDLTAGDLGAQGELTGADASTGQVIDVLVAYTPKARTNAGGDSGMQTRILNAVAAANQGYLNSNIDIYLNLVHTVLVDYTESGTMSTTLSHLRGTTDGYMDGVHALRDQYGADVVVLINTDTDNCGVAYVMRTVSTAFAGSAFAAVRDGCLASGSFAHEIGHLQGNMHDPESSSSVGAYPDSYGHRVCGEFRDIMSYSCSGEPRINYFSNPDTIYQTWPTGVLGERDTARSMGMTAATVASFRPAVFAPTPPAAPSSLQAKLASSNGINLTWIDNASDESGYKVQGSLDGSTWAEIAALGPNVTGFADSGLVAGRTYHYRVYAFNGVGSSSFSNTASATLTVAPSDTVAPTVTIKSPANGATVGLSVKISAVATDNVAVTGMKIFLNDKLLATSNSGSLSTTWSSYTAAKGTYVIRAEATDKAGNLGKASITVKK